VVSSLHHQSKKAKTAKMKTIRKRFAYDVFLSHNAKDKPAVRELAERLKQDGLRVWFDEWIIQPGDSIPLKIEERLEQSRTLILVMSQNAFASEGVTLERHTALFRDPTNTSAASSRCGWTMPRSRIRSSSSPTLIGGIRRQTSMHGC
jgi:hypothetical protein